MTAKYAPKLYISRLTGVKTTHNICYQGHIRSNQSIYNTRLYICRFKIRPLIFEGQIMTDHKEKKKLYDQRNVNMLTWAHYDVGLQFHCPFSATREYPHPLCWSCWMLPLTLPSMRPVCPLVSGRGSEQSPLPICRYVAEFVQTKVVPCSSDAWKQNENM